MNPVDERVVLHLVPVLVELDHFIQPGEMPYDHGLIFQDGRPLIYDSGDYPASLAKIKALVGWDEFPARQAEAAAAGRKPGIGLACYVEGTGVGPYEGAPSAPCPSPRPTCSN
jgi:aerobic carbon-monoxide dehydrogenase large subunit